MSENENSPGQDSVAGEAPKQAVTASGSRRLFRLSLLVAGPLLVSIGGAYIYVNTGRYVETDNAYVKANTVIISPQIAGPITHVAVRENARVHAGDVLFEIDGRPYRIALERAEAQIEAVQAFLKGLQATYQQRLEELKLASTNVAFAERELERERSLAEQQLGSEADLDSARHDLDIAIQQIPIIEQALEQLRAQLGGQVGVTLEGHAAYRAAKSMLDDARLDLDHTVVRAPFDGIASRVPMVGQYLTPGGPAMSIVSDRELWIEANYKETELTHVEVGQPVVIRIDTYPDRDWRGEVDSISPATGAEFSVIPAQNATGNWVKVAQRIPVRIVASTRAGDPPLRAGMSAIVEIDTGHERESPKFLAFLRHPRAAVARPERN